MKVSRVTRSVAALGGIAGATGAVGIVATAAPAEAAGCPIVRDLAENVNYFGAGGDCYDAGLAEHAYYIDGASCHNANMRYWNGGAWVGGNSNNTVCGNFGWVVLQVGTGEGIWKLISNTSVAPLGSAIGLIDGAA
jgi:hypothetical protein